MREPATRTSFQNYPITDPRRIEVAWTLSEADFATLKNGFVPATMDERWFVFYDDWLYFYRSWTGIGVFKTKLIKDENGYSITELWVESTPELHCYPDDERAVSTFRMIVDQILDQH